MDFLALALIFIFGTIIGSFLNVVIYRYNSGTSPLTGRSQCFSCGKVLSWRELFPLVSFLVAKGRCAKCGVRLSWQYPIVEALSGAIFVAVFLLEKPVPETVFLLAIFSTLLVIAVYDLRHQIIPDGLVAFFAVASLGWFVWSTPASFERLIHFPYYWTLIAGPMLFFPFFALWFVSGGKWIGLGDGKLALGIGWFLGATLGGSAVMLAFWIGAGYALAIMAAQKIIERSRTILQHLAQRDRREQSNFSVEKYACVARWCDEAVGVRPRLSLHSEIPFGPFLILGVFIVYFTRVNFFDGSVTLFDFLFK